MAFYWVKTNRLIKLLFPGYLWERKCTKKEVYLTFDDGPTPEITTWVLEQLKKFQAKATFFCIGSNIAANPQLFDKICSEGHAVGNHTHNHVNGWNTTLKDYLVEVESGETELAGKNSGMLFRPPYGKMTRQQLRSVRKLGYKVVMWDVLSADFDCKITPEKCLQNVIRNVRPGSIIIFHDSVKAYRNLEIALPQTLRFLSENKYEFKVLD